MTRTSFDMDPFVVTSLGRKTLRTPVIRHNLNPVYHEKMVFQVMKHEQAYTMSFTVMDRDKFSNNDFVASANFPLQTLIKAAPDADVNTGLYHFLDPALDPTREDGFSNNAAGIKIGISPSPSSSGRSTTVKPTTISSRSSTTSLQAAQDTPAPTSSPLLAPSSTATDTDSGASSPVPTSVPTTITSEGSGMPPLEDDGLQLYRVPLVLKNKERWEDKHFPVLVVKAKYMPYRALRQQFWRLMLSQYDADDSGRIDKVELTTMLDTLGSTLKESTIDGFFERFSAENQSSDTMDLTFDQVVMCLEDTLQALQRIPKPIGKQLLQTSSAGSQDSDEPSSGDDDLNADPLGISVTTIPGDDETLSQRKVAVPGIATEESSSSNDDLHPDDLGDERGEEHVVEILECPLCHQPRLSKRSDADIITHIATCASRDWRQVDNLVMGGFVTSSQAQRKWYTKVITKISYGGYRLGANSANILVQDRITGQINEERMSVYVRLGIRLLYKGLKSRDMEKKRSKFPMGTRNRKEREADPRSP